MRKSKKDRRRSQRVNVRLGVNTIDPGAAGPQQVNLSEKGIFFQTNDSYKADQKIIIVLSDPSLEKSLSLKARVVRVVRGRSGWKWGMGVEFFDVPPREQELLKEMKRRARFTLPRVLLWIKEDALCDLILSRLTEDRHDVVRASGLKELKDKAQEERTTLVVAEAGGSEMELEKLRDAAGDASIIAVSKNIGAEFRTNAGKYGIYECVQKPLDPDEFIKAVTQSIQAYRMAVESEEDAATLGRKKYGSHEEKVPDLVARSGVMVKVRRALRRLAGLRRGHVLVTGESGVGKEVAAKWIHLLSDRGEKPFVTADLSAIPTTLVESTLFGHLRGAFTDAKEHRRGLVEEAGDGTLFLDEVSLVLLELQPKLLRLLAEGEYKKVGGTKMLRTDARIIIATNEDLGSLVRQGRFRDDLYHRLNVHQLRIPPLRERSEEDRHELALQIISRLNTEFGTSVERLGPNAYDQLMTCTWSGNVRELKNAIERSLPGTEGETLHSFDLGTVAELHDKTMDAAAVSQAHVPTWKEHKDNRDDSEKKYLLHLIRHSGGNVAKAAEHAGVTHQYLYKMMKRHGIR